MYVREKEREREIHAERGGIERKNGATRWKRGRWREGNVCESE